MAVLNNVSSRLEKFIKEVYPSSADYKSKAGDLKVAVTTSKSKYQSSLDDIANAWTSSDSAATKQILELVVNACKNIESSIDTDLLAAINDFEKVKEKYDEVEKLRKDNANLKPGEEVEIEGIGVIVDFNGAWWDGKKYVKNDDDKIKKVNVQIEIANRQGEALIDAIKSGLDGVKLGILGNMHRGGSLGPVTSYYLDETAVAAIAEELSSKPLNILQELGCAVVGLVESVVKVAEGVVDFALTIGAGVVSLATHDDDNFLRKIAEFDVARNTVGQLGVSIAGSEEAYENSTGRKVGDFVGSAATHKALWLTGAGAIVSAVSIAGNKSEQLLQEDKTVGEALWKGAALGGASFLGGKVVGGVVNKVSPALSGWVQIVLLKILELYH